MIRLIMRIKELVLIDINAVICLPMQLVIDTSASICTTFGIHKVLNAQVIWTFVSNLMLNNDYIKDNSAYKRYLINPRYKASSSHGLDDLTIINESDKEILHVYYNTEKSEYKIEGCEGVVREEYRVRCYDVQNPILKDI
ncbi:hypothetical protein HRbin04_00488 [archaeon HR04]|nr:hypothetical protein HRbin04_00488 [archaeon HR04]